MRIIVRLSVRVLALGWILTGSVSAAGLGVTITEVMYHPRAPSPGDPGAEFIEIYNQDPTPFDLSGYFFSNGIDYEFESGSFIEGRGHLVLSSDAAAF